MNLADFSQTLRLVFIVPVLTLLLLAAILASIPQNDSAQTHAFLSLLTAAVGLYIAAFMRMLVHRLAHAYTGAYRTLERRTEQALADEERHRTTLASISDAIILCDAAGQVLFINPVAERLTGKTSPDVHLHPVTHIFNAIDEQTQAPLQPPSLANAAQAGLIPFPQRALLLRPDGTSLPIDGSWSPVRNSAKDQPGLILAFRDASATRQAQAEALARERLAAAARIAANIAHEIHNPLDSVSNVLHLLASTPARHDASQLLEMARQEIARAAAVSRPLLALYPKPPALQTRNGAKPWNKSNGDTADP